MPKFITLSDSTLVTGTTSTGQYVSFFVNNKKAAFPIYTFSYSVPDIDIIPLAKMTDFVLDDATLHTSVTSYGAGIALTINTSSFAIPIYKIPQLESDLPDLTFIDAKIVQSLESTGQYLVVKINDNLYGTPLYNFTTEYPFTSTVAQSSIDVSTKINIEKYLFDIVPELGSTNLQPKIRAYSDIMKRIKTMIGGSVLKIDGCDEDIMMAIDQAIELFTKYSGYTEEYLMFNASIYTRGCGIKLDQIFTTTPELGYTCYNYGSAGWDYDLQDYRKVIDCFAFEQGQGTGINTLFTIEQVVANQVYFGNLLGSNGFDLVTFDVLKGWLDTREKVLAQRPYFRFDPRTQLLKVIPEPTPGENYMGVIGCYVERPIRQLISEPWIIFYALALTKIKVGMIRGKYQITLFTGATINYNDILNQGVKEKEELEKQLFTYTGFVENDPPKFFVG